MAGRKGRSGGHNAKTTAQHIQDGTYQPCRHGKRADNKPAKGSPKMPRGLSKLGKQVWGEMVGFLPDGCLGGADTLALRELVRWYELYSNAMATWESDPLDRDARATVTAAWDRFWRIASEFGCTPQARTRLQLTDEEGQPSTPMDKLRELMASRN